MEKDHDNYHSAPPFPQSFNALPLDYSQSHHNLMKFRIGEASGESSHMNNSGMVDYMLHNNNNDPPPQHQHQQQPPCGFYGTPACSSFDKLCFADVMQFADFGPKLALNQTKNCAEGEEDQAGMDPVFFLKFPVLNDKSLEDHQSLMMGTGAGENVAEEEGVLREQDEVEARGVSDSNNSKSVQQHGFVGEDMEKNHSNPTSTVQENNNTRKTKRKRPRTIKTSEEVESQRMTHIAVERNRRKQMNEHLRVLRSLMPGSYVQRGDQASIIGGAIEFVRELEQLLQCLESQKRRRLLGEAHSRQVGDSSVAIQAQQQPPFFPPLGPTPNDQMKLVEFDQSGLREETAENKSCLADVEVKLLGFDAMIKILSRRRPGQLIKTIAALEDLQLIILHTNITTVEQTVLYSFNVKVAGDARFTAEDIASSVQQIFSFIHENTGM